LTGVLPPDAVDRVQAIAQGEPDPLRPAHELVPAISTTVSAALQRAAAVFAKDRPATAEELRQLLRQSVGPTPLTVIGSQRETEPPTIVRPKSFGHPQSFSEDLGDGIEIEMIYLLGGAFLMGSPDGVGDDIEHPQHRVRLSPFYISKYQITQAQWKAVMGDNPSHFKDDNLPVNNVKWFDAREFCRKLSQKVDKKGRYRLPSEAEWEYACRAGTIGNYAGDLFDLAWYYGNAKMRPHPVGERDPNAFGLYDMHGNVLEWCQDWYSGEYYANSPENDPQGSASGTYRIMRGGSYNSNDDQCRSAYRSLRVPGQANVDYRDCGFRVVCLAKTF
jgi:formylglycine-generating enzyme required for sulfatase activity